MAGVRIALALGVLLAAAASADAASPSLSTKDAATAIAKRARADGATNPRVDVCRRLNRSRVVCHLVTKNGQDRYVAYRGSTGRIHVAHRPIIPPGLD